MATHRGKCVVCEEPTSCCNDTHALRCGDGSPCDGMGAQIEFCSLACFDDLAARMKERRSIYLANLQGAPQ